jgi:hypothetical protein
MEILFINDFDCEGCEEYDVMENISRHCNATHNKKIKIYPRFSSYLRLKCFDDSITYPNVVYVYALYLCSNVTLTTVLPDIKNIHIVYNANVINLDDLGSITNIGFFEDMSMLMVTENIIKFKTKMACSPLGNKMYRFTSNKGTWDIKVGTYT